MVLRVRPVSQGGSRASSTRHTSEPMTSSRPRQTCTPVVPRSRARDRPTHRTELRGTFSVKSAIRTRISSAPTSTPERLGPPPKRVSSQAVILSNPALLKLIANHSLPEDGAWPDARWCSRMTSRRAVAYGSPVCAMRLRAASLILSCDIVSSNPVALSRRLATVGGSRWKDKQNPREGCAALVLRCYLQRRAGVARIRQTWLPTSAYGMSPAAFIAGFPALSVGAARLVRSAAG